MTLGVSWRWSCCTLRMVDIDESSARTTCGILISAVRMTYHDYKSQMEGGR
jgi:hypothetical protein